jgi:hypothetical protein
MYKKQKIYIFGRKTRHFLHRVQEGHRGARKVREVIKLYYFSKRSILILLMFIGYFAIIRKRYSDICTKTGIWLDKTLLGKGQGNKYEPHPVLTL